MNLLIISAIFLFNLNSLEITDCKLMENSAVKNYSVSFNSYFSIDKIEYRNKLNLPVVLYNNEAYEDIKILSKEIYVKIENCILSEGKIKKENNKEPEFKILAINKLKSEHRLFNISLLIDSDLVVVLGLVKNKNGGMWIAYPDGFKILNKDYKKRLENFIIKSVYD